MNTIDTFTNQIICGDCISVMATMPSASVDFVLTDPPYLVNYRSSDGRRYPNDDNDRWLKPAFAQAYRVLKADRFCVCFYGWNKADRFLSAWKAVGFQPVGHLVWTKNYSSKERFVRYCHESAYLLAKGNPPKPRVGLRDVLDWRYTGDTLHPTQKPVMALLPLIMAYSKVDDIVLDPFAGSGTTAVAAQTLGRRYIGIEITPKYARIARERLARERRGITRAAFSPKGRDLTGLFIALHYNHMDKNTNNEITLADIKATLDTLATKDDVQNIKNDVQNMQRTVNAIMEVMAETKESVTGMKDAMQDMAEEMNATHADVRYIRSTVDKLVQSDIAHAAAIEDLTSRVHRLEQKAGLAK